MLQWFRFFLLHFLSLSLSGSRSLFLWRFLSDVNVSKILRNLLLFVKQTLIDVVLLWYERKSDWSPGTSIRFSTNTADWVSSSLCSRRINASNERKGMVMITSKTKIWRTLNRKKDNDGRSIENKNIFQWDRHVIDIRYSAWCMRTIFSFFFLFTENQTRRALRLNDILNRQGELAIDRDGNNFRPCMSIDRLSVRNDQQSTIILLIIDQFFKDPTNRPVSMDNKFDFSKKTFFSRSYRKWICLVWTSLKIWSSNNDVLSETH